MKFILKLLGCIVLLVVIGLGAVWFYMDQIIKEAVVRAGPEVTGTEVSLDSASLSLINGSGSLTGLKVANPEGYKSPEAFSLGAISMKVDTDSIGSEEYNIRLSQRRAVAMKKLLVENGISSDSIVAVGIGEKLPIADNSTAAGQAINRRGEFVFRSKPATE